MAYDTARHARLGCGVAAGGSPDIAARGAGASEQESAHKFGRGQIPNLFAKFSKPKGGEGKCTGNS